MHQIILSMLVLRKRLQDVLLGETDGTINFVAIYNRAARELCTGDIETVVFSGRAGWVTTSLRDWASSRSQVLLISLLLRFVHDMFREASQNVQYEGTRKHLPSSSSYIRHDLNILRWDG
jgi:hypothetical protein